MSWGDTEHTRIFAGVRDFEEVTLNEFQERLRERGGESPHGNGAYPANRHQEHLERSAHHGITSRSLVGEFISDGVHQLIDIQGIILADNQRSRGTRISPSQERERVSGSE